MTTETKPVTDLDKDEIWIPYSELKGYLEHLRGALTTMIMGIEKSMTTIENNAAAEKAAAEQEGEDTNDDDTN